MKTLLIYISVILTINTYANELKWVDEQIQAIKPPRNGVSKTKINGLSNPFVFLQKNKDISNKKSVASRSKKTTPSLLNKNKVSKKSNIITLDAIINKSALINGKWYKINDKIGKYTLSSVERTTAILKYKNKELYLSTNSRNKHLKFKNN